MNALTAPSDILAGAAPKWQARDDVYQVGQLLGDAGQGRRADARSAPPTSASSRCSDHLKEIVYRCIGERRKRYESADELIEALRTPPAALEVGRAAHAEGRAPRVHRHPREPRNEAIARRARAGAIVHGGPSARTTVVVRGRPNPLQAAGRDGGPEADGDQAAAREGAPHHAAQRGAVLAAGREKGALMLATLLAKTPVTIDRRCTRGDDRDRRAVAGRRRSQMVQSPLSPRDGGRQKGGRRPAFADPAFMTALDVVFANLYFAAIARADLDSAGAPSAWRPLLSSRTDRRLARLQFALAGMNAHINRDLPVGIVEVFNALGGDPTDDRTRRQDFDSVNSLLEQVEEEVKVEFSRGLIQTVDVAAGQLDDVAAMWKVRVARAAAWTNAGGSLDAAPGPAAARPVSRPARRPHRPRGPRPADSYRHRTSVRGRR